VAAADRMIKMIINRIGEALYGGNWQHQMSDLLEVNDRTIRRWVDGSAKVPQGVWNELFVRLDFARSELDYLMGRIREEIDKKGGEK
jgi:hypothetical protein